jgi:hypothetical protein
MTSTIKFLRVLSALACLSFFVSVSAFAGTRVRGGSGYGPNDTAGTQDCLNQGIAVMPTACEAFQPGNFNGDFTFTLNGNSTTHALPAVQFSDGTFNDIGLTFDVFDVGVIADGTTISMGSTALGVFVCSAAGLPSDHAFDSNGPDHSNLSPTTPGGPGLPCTPILLPAVQTGATYSDSNVDGSPALPFDFVINPDGSVTITKGSGDDVVLFDQEGAASVSTTPEPATFALLGLGLVALAGLLLRRPA